MRRLLTPMLLFLLCPPTFAISLNLHELNLHYKDGGGVVNTGKVKFDHEDVSAEVLDYDFNIEKVNDNLQFTNHNTNLRIKKFEEKLSLLKDLKELRLSRAGLTYTDTLFASIEEFYTNFGRNQFNIHSLYFECPSLETDPVASCLKQAALEAQSLTLPNVLSGILYEELLTTEPEEQALKADKSYRPRIKNIKLSIKENNFAGSAVMKLLFNVKFNIYGKLLIDQEQKEIVIKNFTVKKGIIPVTKVVLFALKRMKIESVKIVGNTITIKL